MNNKKYIGLLGLLFPLGMMAQSSEEVLCDFESDDSYASVGVYDTWADSPFRKGVLNGNCKVVDNFLNEADPTTGVARNGSSRILGVQRSRFGSNTFGALVKLKNPFTLPRDTRYLHVKIYTPKAGKVMVIGLGNRDDRPWQPELTEQFWSTASLSVKENEWTDCVFQVSGANGITIRNLLIVVDRNSTHNLSEDFVAYVDDIVLNDDASSNIKGGVYGLNFDEDTKMTRNDRYTTSLTLNTSDGSQTLSINQNSDHMLYYKKLDYTFTAKPGTTVTPSVSYQGSWMAGYCYIDKGNDGQFDVAYDQNRVVDQRDLMSWSLFKDYDSKGNKMNGNTGPSVNAPAFTLPADLAPGFYRLRYKIDWDNVDPAGNDTQGNTITANGGVIVDALVNVHNDNVNLYRHQDDLGGGLNGAIQLADGTAVTGATAPFNQALTIKAEPAPGFLFDKVVIRHGYNLSGEQSLYGNQQWEEETVTANQFTDGKYTIPASKVDGDIRFLPYFVNDPTAVVGVESEAAFSCVAGTGELTLKAAKATEVTVADIQGRSVFHGTVEGTRTLSVVKGVYVVNGTKVVVK